MIFNNGLFDCNCRFMTTFCDLWPQSRHNGTACVQEKTGKYPSSPGKGKVWNNMNNTLDQLKLWQKVDDFWWLYSEILDILIIKTIYTISLKFVQKCYLEQIF
jgi:hypothetical protein